LESSIDLGFLLKNLGISNKKLLAITIINSGTLSWFMFLSQVNPNFNNLFANFTSEQSWIYVGSALFYFFSAFSAIVGSILSKRLNGKKFLLTWISFGVLTTGALLFFQGEVYVLIFGSLLGVSLGLGFPYTLSLLARNTEVQQRGRVSGILLLQTFVMLAFAIIITDFLKLGVIGTVIFLIILRSASFFALLIDDCKGCSLPSISKRENSDSLLSILKYRNFVMYFFPWIMFIVAIVLTDHIVWPTFPSSPEYDVVKIAVPLHYAGTAIFGLVSGVLCDRFGRRLPIIAGLIMLGSSFVLIASVISPWSIFVHLMTIGIAFGFLMVVYTTIPGDLASSCLQERYYALILVLPLAIYGGLGAIPSVFGASVAANILAPVLSMLLFINVIPILYSEETLSARMLRERKMKKYIEKLEQIVQETKEE
jgi:MFS family permease